MQRRLGEGGRVTGEGGGRLGGPWGVWARVWARACGWTCRGGARAGTGRGRMRRGNGWEHLRGCGSGGDRPRYIQTGGNTNIGGSRASWGGSHASYASVSSARAGSSGKSHQILPSRRRSTALMRPRPGCASPRHPPRGAPQPGVGQPVGGARTALVFRGLQNTFRDQQAGPSPQGRVPAMRGAVHHVSSRDGQGLHAQHARRASARQARTAAVPQTAIGRWLCRGGSNGPSNQTDQACDWDHGCAHR